MVSLRSPDASSLRLPAGAGIASSPRCPVTLRCFFREDPGESSSSSVSYPTDVLRAVQNSGVIACLRADSMELAVEAARAALSGGISLLEIVISTPGVFEAIQELVREHPSSLIGVYPVSLLGGPQYISALKKPFPNIPMVASQGITIDSIEQYIHCGASAVVLSDAIFNKESMRQRDFDTICQLAGEAVSQANNAMQRKPEAGRSYVHIYNKKG